MKTRILQYQEVNKEQWNAFVNANSMGYAYHLYDVIALDRWINDKNISFAIWDDDHQEIVMVAMLHIEKKEQAEVYYRLHSRWGFVVKDGLARKEWNKLRVAYMEYIDSLCAQYNIRSFDTNIAPLSEYMQPDKNQLINPAVYFGFQPGVRYTYVVDLSPMRGDILAKCEQTTRQAIRKIGVGGIYEVVEAKPCEEDLATYIELHEETYTRTNAAGAIIYEEYQRNIFMNLIPQNIAKVYFLKDVTKEEIVAANVILIYKNTAYYWWGASKNDKEIGINKYLLFESMIRVKEEFALDNQPFWFETGGAYPHIRSGKNKGLNDFKKSFGTFLHPIYTGTYVIYG